MTDLEAHVNQPGRDDLVKQVREKIKETGVDYIYYQFVKPNPILDNLMIYWAFVFFWIFYGIVYQEEDETRNIAYNVLDLFAKCFVGIFFWAYFTKIFSLK